MSKSFNKSFKRSARPSLSLDDYVSGISQGNIAVLSQAITLVESSIRSDSKLADDIIENCLPKSGKSIRIGITGVPGVGKSTFIETFGGYLTSKEHKVAVLAIDPSSQNSGGSILGDKTRMESLVQNTNVFIRPSPSKGSLGGVAQATRETIVLCEAAGFDVVLIETVGVGQSEIAVRSMVDFFLLLMLAGAGDELQGIKRGIMEMADAVVITKADEDNLNNAKRAMLEYKNALHLFPASKSQWIPKVEHCSALQNYNLDKVWGIIDSYKNLTINNGFYDENRSKQAKFWLDEKIVELLRLDFESTNQIQETMEKLNAQVIKGEKSPFKAADEIMKIYRGRK
ncbi:MAG: LAO/AO transport system kinase [Flavobacteriales bacterium]|jgi:LAO/AO transport system kinase